MLSVRLVKLHPKNKEIYLFEKEGVAPQPPMIECCFLMFVKKSESSTVMEIFESQPVKMVEFYEDEEVYEFITRDGVYHLFVNNNKSENLPFEDAA